MLKIFINTIAKPHVKRLLKALPEWATIKIVSAWKYQPRNRQTIGWPVCNVSNDCKFLITPTMNFGIAKLPKTFYKKTPPKKKKKLNAKENNKELSSIEDRKVHTNLCVDSRKSFVTWQIQCRRYGGPGEGHLPFWWTKKLFLEHHVKTRKPTMIQKRNNYIQSSLHD